MARHQVSLGGAVTMSNVVVSRLVDLVRDWDLMHKLLAAVGIATITAAKQPSTSTRCPTAARWCTRARSSR